MKKQDIVQKLIKYEPTLHAFVETIFGDEGKVISQSVVEIAKKRPITQTVRIISTLGLGLAAAGFLWWNGHRRKK